MINTQQRQHETGQENFADDEQMLVTIACVPNYFFIRGCHCFSDRTLQLRSLSGLVCGEQDLLKTECSKEKCTLQ